MSTHKSLAITVLALLLATGACANNIQVNNLTLTANNEVEGSIRVRFDLTWANSWYTTTAIPTPPFIANAWDAAWIFVKYKHFTTGEWHHARLHGDAAHTAPTGSTISTGLLTPGSAFDATTNWGVGAFVRRNGNGIGTFTANGTELRWNYGQNGITYTDIAEVQVFALEMVYVRQGSFWVGDGGTALGRFIAGGSTNNPFRITSEAALTIDSTAGALWGTTPPNVTSIMGDVGTLPAVFPKGFAGFYCMKYEITQQQYVDFLNSLTRTQQNTRTGTDLAVGVTSVTNRVVLAGTSENYQFIHRNGIRCDGTIDANDPIIFYCDLNGNGTAGEANDGQWIACNWLSWADLLAYLDWSGLRPMTELEYEKACRGPLMPVANEYAWGNNNISNAANITNSGAINESSNTAGANVVAGFHPNVRGPMRVGVFAGGATNRVNAGAGYYGAMELTGNVHERAVSVNNTEGRNYTGALGNGVLDATGNADATNWPATNEQAAGIRGGSWVGVNVVSSKVYFSGPNLINFRFDEFGGRGVRQLP